MNSFAAAVYALLLLSSFFSNKYVLSELGFQVIMKTLHLLSNVHLKNVFLNLQFKNFVVTQQKLAISLFYF